MARILVTGSADGLGQMAAQRLVDASNEVVLHARNTDRARQAMEAVPGAQHVFAINVLAPYLLTALIHQPRRLVYLSSGMHRGGDPNLADLQWRRRRWNGSQAYSDSKLFDVVLAFAVA